MYSVNQKKTLLLLNHMMKCVSLTTAFCRVSPLLLFFVEEHRDPPIPFNACIRLVIVDLE